MQEDNEMRDRLLKEFTENYMEKLFYFCLKKTGSQIEAEDLTQDIALQHGFEQRYDSCKVLGVGMADRAQPLLGMGKRKA